MKTSLLMIDIQMDYFSGGRMEVPGAVQASEAAAGLLKAFRTKGLPVVHIQHVSTRPGAGFLLPGTDGIEFHQNVSPLPGEAVIRKNFPNSFRGTGLGSLLQGQKIERLVVCGMMSQMCVDTTVRAAFDAGYQCLVAHDACAARTLTFQGTAVPAEQVHAAYMAALGAVFAKVMSSREIIAEL